MKTPAYFVLPALLVLPLTQAAAFDRSGWTWERPINAAVSRTQFVRLPLPLDVLGTSQASLADLRVVDQRGALVPYVTRRAGETGPATIKWKSASLLNHVFQPGRYSRVTVDFGVQAPRNRVKILTSGNNFRRRVTIEGGTDGVAWDILRENGWLFSIPLPGKMQTVDEISFPTSAFRYLRITVYNMPDDPRRIAITAVQTANWVVPAETPPLPVAFDTSPPLFDDKTRQSTYTLDLGYRNVPLASIEVTVSDPFYYRAYVLEGRNAEKVETRRRAETKWEVEEHDAPWRPITSGVLYRVRSNGEVTTSSSIRRLHASFRYLRLRIFEQDNPPLTIASLAVRRWERSLVFECRPGDTYTLIGGNSKAVAPSFDLANTRQGLAQRDLPSVTLGNARPITRVAAPAPWDIRYRAVLWIALLAAVATVLALIAKNLGRISRA